MTTANGTLLFVMCGSNIDVSYSTRYSHNLSSAIAILSNFTVGVFRLILSNVQLRLQSFNGGLGTSRSFSQKLIKLKSVEVLLSRSVLKGVSAVLWVLCHHPRILLQPHGCWQIGFWLARSKRQMSKETGRWTRSNLTWQDKWLSLQLFIANNDEVWIESAWFLPMCCW